MFQFRIDFDIQSVAHHKRQPLGPRPNSTHLEEPRWLMTVINRVYLLITEPLQSIITLHKYHNAIYRDFSSTQLTTQLAALIFTSVRVGLSIITNWNKKFSPANCCIQLLYIDKPVDSFISVTYCGKLQIQCKYPHAPLSVGLFQTNFASVDLFIFFPLLSLFLSLSLSLLLSLSVYFTFFFYLFSNLFLIFIFPIEGQYGEIEIVALGAPCAQHNKFIWEPLPWLRERYRQTNRHIDRGGEGNLS